MEPRHHSTEFFADLFERMFSVLTAHSEEVSAATGFVFEEPIFGEGAGLDVVQDFFHGFLRFLGYDTRTSGVIAIFSGVADGFAQSTSDRGMGDRSRRSDHTSAGDRTEIPEGNRSK